METKRTGPAVTEADAKQMIRLLAEYPPILGIVGPLGCGKTTQADAIVAQVKGRRLSCAGPIRDMLAALGVSREDLTQNKNRPQDWLHGKTSRELLKSLGTEWGRVHVGESIWVNAMLKAAQNTAAPVVCDDIRFDNEARAIKAAGGHLVYINRAGMRYSYEHPSECGLSNAVRCEIDAVLDLSGAVWTRETLIGADIMEDLIPRRPWWANYRIGHAYARWKNTRSRRARVSAVATASFGITPQEAASVFVPAWGRLTNGDVLPAR